MRVGADEIAALEASGQFDAAWYSRRYPDVVVSGMSPAEHFLWLGVRLGRAPSETAYLRGNGAALRWCIIATPHVLFIAHTLAENIRRHGWSVEIVTEPPAEFSHDYYIVLCAQMFDRLPPGEKRIIYQLEQSASSRWFSPKYFNDMQNSFAVLDYSLTNIDYLSTRGVAYPQVSYLPIGTSESYFVNNPPIKDIDVLFYGDYKSSPRRRALIDSAKRKYNVTLIDDVFGEKMKAAISRSRLVLNVHYYEGAQLETPRIQECVSLGVPVVSEGTDDQDEYPELASAVRFFPVGDADAMVKALDDALSKSTPEREDTVKAVKDGGARLRFMFDRFLIGAGILPTGAIERVEAMPIAAGDVFALSLPETTKRRKIFNEEIRLPECKVFDGIRRRPGWIGCGMSYKYLAMSALKAGADVVTILEDDVLLPSDYDAKISVIREFLGHRKDEWDVFCGVVAHLHDEVKVLDVRSHRGIDFVTIDKMTSSVFNIYNRRCLEVLARWNPRIEDSKYNTIDRFLENSGLKIVVTDPYLVGHREEVHSTLWGFQNTQYRDMINESQSRLNALKRAWLKDQGASLEVRSELASI
jgi:hypothetical protein